MMIGIPGQYELPPYSDHVLPMHVQTYDDKGGRESGRARILLAKSRALVRNMEKSHAGCADGPMSLCMS